MSIFDTPISTLSGEPTTLGALIPRAALLVNVASKCGLTPQYAGLEKLYQQYKGNGFTVLGVPCNQFAGQEPGSEDEWVHRARTGRVVPGVELRICDDDGTVLPWDGESVGEIEVRGPWITGSYYRDDTPEKFHDGWLRTGDVAFVDRQGFVQITDRSKDVIKSGGEWISSVELENEIMAHPKVAEAAVVAVPDARWDERPLACVVLEDGVAADAEALREFLGHSVARWQLPERWAFIAEVPKTSVGKFRKLELREMFTS